MTFGEKIRKIRIEKKMSQAQVARKMQISQQAYAKYEKATDVPKFVTCRRIAEALKCEITDFLTFPDDFNFTAKDYYEDIVAKDTEQNQNEQYFQPIIISPDTNEVLIIEKFRTLSDTHKQAILSYMDFLNKYEKKEKNDNDN